VRHSPNDRGRDSSAGTLDVNAASKRYQNAVPVASGMRQPAMAVVGEHGKRRPGHTSSADLMT
jgi:hypothetical protein